MASSRQTKTPGKADEKPEQTTLLGEVVAADQQPQSTENTADGQTPQQSTEAALVPAEQLDDVAQKLAAAEAKIKALEAAQAKQSKPEKVADVAQAPQSTTTPKEVQFRDELTDKGWIRVEV